VVHVGIEPEGAIPEAIADYLDFPRSKANKLTPVEYRKLVVGDRNMQAKASNNYIRKVTERWKIIES